MTELAPYREYKDSGVPTLGAIPTSFEIVRLGDIARIINGFPFDAAMFGAEGAPLLRIRDLDRDETATRFSGADVPGVRVTSDDVLVGMDGDFNVGRWRGIESALLNQRMLAIRTDTVTARLIELSLPTPLQRINDETYATTVKHLSSAQVRAIRIAIPTSLSDRESLVSFLDRETAEIDAFIADQEELIGLLTERRAATITHAVTKGLDPSAPMKDSGVEWLGEVPASWAVGPMSRWCTVTLGKMLDAGKPAPAGSEPRPYLRAANIRPGWISLDSVYEMPMRPAEVSNLNLLAGDLLVVEGGATVGTNAIVRDDMPGWTYQKTINRVRSARGPSTRFIGYYLDVLRLRGVIEMISAASTFQHLTAEKLGALTLAAPSATESVTIADYLDHETAELDAAVADAREAIALSKERRAALISAAVAGKIDVRGLA